MTKNPFQEEALRRVEALFSRFQEGAVLDIRRQITDPDDIEIEIMPTHCEYLPVTIQIYPDDIQFSLGDLWYERPLGLNGFDVEKVEWR